MFRKHLIHWLLQDCVFLMARALLSLAYASIFNQDFIQTSVLPGE